MIGHENPLESKFGIMPQSRERSLSGLGAGGNVPAHALNRISEADRLTRDFTLESLREALREVVACFPVYSDFGFF